VSGTVGGGERFEVRKEGGREGGREGGITFVLPHFLSALPPSLLPFFPPSHLLTGNSPIWTRQWCMEWTGCSLMTFPSCCIVTHLSSFPPSLPPFYRKFPKLDKAMVYEMDRVFSHDIPKLLEKASRQPERGGGEIREGGPESHGGRGRR